VWESHLSLSEGTTVQAGLFKMYQMLQLSRKSQFQNTVAHCMRGKTDSMLRTEKS